MGTWSFGDLLHSLDSRPEVRFREFERICRWFLRNSPEYRSRLRQVWLWSEWPDAWGRDAGIDLIAEEHDGGLWAIQAKLYDPAYAIKKADVDSFLSESARWGFAYRLLIATTDRLGPTARRTLDAQRQPVGYLLRSQLELAPVVWPASPRDLRPRRPSRKKPFPHVREAISATVEGFANHERGQLIMACGTGKTLAGLWIAERLRSTRTLVLVPSLSLLAQTLRVWSANASGTFEYLAVCSDATVVGEDEFVQHTSELGLPVTTIPEAIAAFLRRRGRRVVFATYQSSIQITAAYRSRTPAFDLAIADEAHRCAGRVGTEFGTILDANRIRARRRLFMTATPRYYTPRLRHEAGLLDVEIASMDDKTVFGPVLHQLTFAEAIERDLLSDYQVVVVGVDQDTYRTWAERGELVSRDGMKITDARTLAGEIALAKAMRKHDLRRVISFHGRVKGAREFSAEVPDVIAWMPARARPTGALWSEHVSGAMTSGHRDRLLLRFRNLALGERGLLSNARCLGEGVDVPTIDGVAFIDARRSTIDIIQAVGRAIRKAPDKRVGTIVLPVFIDEEDPEQALGDSTFQNVWETLKALRAHDERLGEELDELRRSLGARRSPPRRPGKIKLDVPVARVGAAFAQAFNVRLIECTTEAWEFSYGRLLSFLKREGNSRVASEYRDDDGYRLGRWVAHQRQLGKAGKLSGERAQRLGILPAWTWSTQEADWDKGYARLLAFVAREGHVRVPREYRDDDGYQLGWWVGTQRQAGSRGQLAKERMERLTAVPGWEWKLRRVRKADWEEGYAHMKRFVAREGHGRVPFHYRDRDGYMLGRWLAYQERLVKAGRVPVDRRQLLEKLPDWTILSKKEAAWEDGYERVARFAQLNGHSRVPSPYQDDDGFKLGAWVAKQRSARKNGRLSADRTTRLESLPGWGWVAREPSSSRQRPVGQLRARWEANYRRLIRYVEREGHARVPARYRDDAGVKLGSWVGVQRSLRAKNRLASERVERLESLPGWVWNRNIAAWDDGYLRLLRFVQHQGHSRVPTEYRDEDGYQLGWWVHSQRQARKRGELNQPRVRRLEELPGWIWAARS